MGNKYFHKIYLILSMFSRNKRGYVYMSNELKTPFRYDYVERAFLDHRHLRMQRRS